MEAAPKLAPLPLFLPICAAATPICETPLSGFQTLETAVCCPANSRADAVYATSNRVFYKIEVQLIP